MDNLLSEGLSLMVLGMGFVFVFLTLLVIATAGMSRLVTRYGPAPVVEPVKPRPAAAPSVTADTKNDELIAVMSAAIHKYRS